jgi:hypothetical protein
MRIFRLLLLLALLAACSDTAGPSAGDVRISTSVNRSAPRGQLNVSAIVENRGSRTVLLPQCGDRVVVLVDRREDGRWELYKGGYCIADVAWGPLELAPGAGTTAAESITERGTYRLRLETSYPDDREVVRTVVSAAFEIQ